MCCMIYEIPYVSNHIFLPDEQVLSTLGWWQPAANLEFFVAYIPYQCGTQVLLERVLKLFQSLLQSVSLLLGF